MGKSIRQILGYSKRGPRKPLEAMSLKELMTRERYLREHYKINSLTYDKILQEQEGLCGICRIDPLNTSLKKLVVDHNHKSGQIRGLLCTNCNTGLGMFRDNPDIVEIASLYLREYLKLDK